MLRVIDKTAMVFGQMNEPPGARLRVALTALTMAEYFRDEVGSDVLIFIDNIFRFVQAGSEVSALLGRMPSAVGYQPNLNTEIGELQERITSTKSGSITSVQAIYVPADDYTDPAPAATRNPANASFESATTANSRLSAWRARQSSVSMVPTSTPSWSAICNRHSSARYVRSRRNSVSSGIAVARCRRCASDSKPARSVIIIVAIEPDFLC